MAHKKGGGSTRNGRDSNPKYRGVKLYGGEKAKVGSIIVRQTGTPKKPGLNTRLGRDYTIYAMTDGVVKFRGRYVDVIPHGENGAEKAAANGS